MNNESLTNEQALAILLLLSAMESWTLAQAKPLPDYLHNRLSLVVDMLSQRLLRTEGQVK